MFTGIIKAVVPLVSLEKKKETLLTIRAPEQAGMLHMGDSLAVNGVCLTVVSITDHGLIRVHLSRETLDRSNFGDLLPGSIVNIELPLTGNDFLSGHWVTGHIEGTVRVRSINKSSGRHRFSFTYSIGEWRRFLVPKGSVALNGISLTIVDVHPTWFSVEIIPHTLQTTNLKLAQVGERLNVELDFIAKYLYNLLLYRLDWQK